MKRRHRRDFSRLQQLSGIQQQDIDHGSDAEVSFDYSDYGSYADLDLPDDETDMNILDKADEGTSSQSYLTAKLNSLKAQRRQIDMDIQSVENVLRIMRRA